MPANPQTGAPWWELGGESKAGGRWGRSAADFPRSAGGRGRGRELAQKRVGRVAEGRDRAGGGRPAAEDADRDRVPGSVASREPALAARGSGRGEGCGGGMRGSGFRVWWFGRSSRLALSSLGACVISVPWSERTNLSRRDRSITQRGDAMALPGGHWLPARDRRPLSPGGRDQRATGRAAGDGGWGGGGRGR